MAQLILNRGTARTGLLKRFLPRNLSFGPYFLIISMIVFTALITVTTLMFSTRQVTKGYVLNSLESDHQKLLRQLEVKDMQISDVRALSTIESSAKVQQMVRPQQVVYLEGHTSLASR